MLTFLLMRRFYFCLKILFFFYLPLFWILKPCLLPLLHLKLIFFRFPPQGHIKYAFESSHEYLNFSSFSAAIGQWLFIELILHITNWNRYFLKKLKKWLLQIMFGKLRFFFGFFFVFFFSLFLFLFHYFSFYFSSVLSFICVFSRCMRLPQPWRTPEQRVYQNVWVRQ